MFKPKYFAYIETVLGFNSGDVLKRTYVLQPSFWTNKLKKLDSFQTGSPQEFETERKRLTEQRKAEIVVDRLPPKVRASEVGERYISEDDTDSVDVVVSRRPLGNGLSARVV